ncbi:hypothetical protein RHGRI_031410 [Rhododendron griersonianum]|nr:hypothetical protein RHGRI_031410 [Rhododendron griersonianum]
MKAPHMNNGTPEIWSAAELTRPTGCSRLSRRRSWRRLPDLRRTDLCHCSEGYFCILRRVMDWKLYKSLQWMQGLRKILQWTYD